MENTNNQEGAPVVLSERKTEWLNIKGGNLGFHYTVDSALSDAFRHGLLSRMEEGERGLNVRKRASRSDPRFIYFTTRINDLYFNHNANLDKALEDVVGIAIDRPDFARSKEGHFGEEDCVDPKRFKALVLIDMGTFEKPPKSKRDTYDVYEFGEPLPEDYVRARVESLKEICQESGIAIPIYGISGKIYWPEKRN